MCLEHCSVIHLVDVVTGENNEIFRVVVVDKAHVLIDCVCSSLVPGRTACRLIRRKDIRAGVITVEVPRMSVSDISIESERLILCENADDLKP